ncbi:MAG: hypothetical protein R3D62_13510 [Xanthobacteraceae bacterium]
MTGLAIVAVAGIASFVLVWHVDSAQNPDTTPTDVIASRFPAEWGARAPVSAAAFALANVQKPEVLANTSTIDFLSSPLLFEQARQGLASLPPYLTPNPDLPDGAEVVIPRPRDGASQKVTLFTEAQVASIKERLKLSPDQEKLWPPVEAALRAIAWRGSRATLNHKTATLDPKSLEKATTALRPFIKKLRADQKDELRSIAHVMGLGKLASQL